MEARMRKTLISSAVFLAMSSTISADAPETKTLSVGEVRGDSIRDLIVGKWEPKQNQMVGAVVEFKKNGKILVSAQQISFEGTYKFVTKDQIELKLAVGGAEQSVKVNIKLTRNEMTATEIGKNTTETFKRIK
jgi:uncharacterized protein (TIGR03066 family)